MPWTGGDHNLPNGYRWATDAEFAKYDVDNPQLGSAMTGVYYTPDGLIYTEKMQHLAVLDCRNFEILTNRLADHDKRVGPRVGDWVEFTDGITRRLSHDWGETMQTSDGGNYYLGNEGISLSNGSLHRGIDVGTLVLTSEMRLAPVWFFSHDNWTAQNGVHIRVPVRVFRCTLASKEAS